MKSTEINAVKTGDSDIVKIMSGGVLLWRLDIQNHVVWIKSGTTTSDDSSYNKKLYKSYQVSYGKAYGSGIARYGLWGDLFYYVSDTELKMFELFKQTMEKNQNGDTRQVMHFNVYDGRIISN